jgi:hypothetical protein
MLTPPDHPPKPRPAFRVGIIGHRPNRLAAADLPVLKSRLADIVLMAANALLQSAGTGAFTDEKPLLRLVTSLAEGADRLFVQALLDDPRIAALPIELAFSCPLPFFQPEYEQDFSPPAALHPAALQEFHALLDAMRRRAAVDLFELDGSHAAGAAPYAAAGRVIINQSDLLLFVWDGRWLGEAGGTEEMLRLAAATGVPTVWIDAHAPHHAALLPPAVAFAPPIQGERVVPPNADLTRSLPRLITGALDLPAPEPPAPHDAQHHPRHTPRAERAITFKDFRAERPPRFRFPILWRAFHTLVSGSFKRHPPTPLPGPQSTPAVTAAAGYFDPLFAWPDRLAVYYADVYRSAFVLSYSLAALAVGFSLLPLVNTWEETPVILCGILELLTILTILAIVFRGRFRRWHERWIDYRFAAELIRHVRLALPLGGARFFPRLPAHLATYGHPAATWMAWYTHAHERAFGLPAARLDRPHLHAALHQLQTLLQNQVAYHRDNADRYHRIEHRLHFTGILLLTLTLLACALHLAAELSHHLHFLPSGFLSFISGFFPAFGGAIVGISNQGEFRRIAKRSLSMQQQLSHLLSRLQNLQSALDGPNPHHRQLSTEAATLASQAARLMVNETLDWRVVLLDRPLELHA